jgi:hypothetical protein
LRMGVAETHVTDRPGDPNRIANARTAKTLFGWPSELSATRSGAHVVQSI